MPADPPCCADPGIASQIKATLSTLLAAAAATEPSRWLTLCSEVVMAAPPGSTAAAEQEAAAAAEAAAQDSDEEEEGAVARPPPPPPPTAAPAVSPAAGGAGARGLTLSPRLRTRLFAAQLLLQIPGLVRGADPRHTDLGAAQACVKAGGGGDWLVLRLQQLVDLAFRMASGQLEVSDRTAGGTWCYLLKCGARWALGGGSFSMEVMARAA